ncbi:MAG: molybdopterin oxidoreductase family protein [Rhodospirillaceae bacterium]|nr:molybdopterin oxidoreductase family protein [Rhodospirillaceae bacterium]
MPLDIVPSVCPHDCPSTCALEVERLDARTIGRVRGAGGNSYTAGVVCAKTARYAERVHHKDRLTVPLLRTGPKGAGQFKEIGWDEALDRVADAFKAATAKYGPETVWPYYYAGTMGLVQRDGIHRLRHVMKYSGQDSTICIALTDAGWLAGHGVKRGLDPREMHDSDLIVMWGGNPVATQVNVMTHVSVARKQRGAKLVHVDVYRNGTAEAADIFIMVRPGTDGALAAAVGHVLLKEGYADRDYLAKYTDFSAEVEAHYASRTPEWAEKICGVPAREIIDFARLYGRTKNAFMRVGYGFSRSRNGAAQLHAATCLPALTGAWQHKGGGALYSNSAIYPWNKSMIEGKDRIDPKVRLLDQSRIGPVLVGEPDALKGGPPVTAMLVQNTNPAVVAPEQNKVIKGLMREDLFLCVHEQLPTDTVKYADVVLPATTFLEHDDIYQGGGHTFIQMGAKVIEAHAQSRSNHEVLQGLAKRLGAEHPAFDMTSWELADWTLKASGFPDAATLKEKRWHDCAIPFERAHFLDGFGTPDRRFHFKPDWKAIGPAFAAMPALPDHFDNIEKATEEHPFRMTTSPARQFLNTSFTEMPTSVAREVRPSLLLHPDDAARLGVVEGGKVRIGNRRGDVLLHAKLFDGLRPGVVVAEGIWPNSRHVEGKGINVLIGSDAAPPAGGAVFHDTAVWVRSEP